ncbi:MAG TPA: hypothetical protein VN442_19615 [Bryobacteraceae bacterium]|nr:hypothetical protein [Bryobacteraceae bacterium]
MNSTMTARPVLTDEEWALVIELLQREREELPAEIHHTRSSAYRDELHQRLDAISRLLDRLKG